MVFAGKITPRYITRGTLPNKLGSFELSNSAKGEIPLRLVYYSAANASRYITWQNIKPEEISSDSVITLPPQTIDSAINPQNEPAGGLLLHRGQMLELSWGILTLAGERFWSDMEKYCEWIVLLPELKQNGREAVGFDLSMIAAGDKELGLFLRRFTDDVVGLHDKLIFINPYYGGQGFFFGGFELIRGMGSLLGRRVAQNAAAGIKMTLPDELVNYSAAAYSRAIAEDFLDISLVYGLLGHEEKEQLLSVIDVRLNALRGGLTCRERALVGNILKS